MFRRVFAFLLISSGAANAEIWSARCRGMLFEYDRTRKNTAVYFMTNAGNFQVAQGSISFDNGVALRSAMKGNAPGFNGGNLTEIGLNRSRNIVYVQYQNPETGQINAGKFCDSKIDVR